MSAWHGKYHLTLSYAVSYYPLVCYIIISLNGGTFIILIYFGSDETIIYEETKIFP